MSKPPAGSIGASLDDGAEGGDPLHYAGAGGADIAQKLGIPSPGQSANGVANAFGLGSGGAYSANEPLTPGQLQGDYTSSLDPNFQSNQEQQQQADQNRYAPQLNNQQANLDRYNSLDDRNQQQGLAQSYQGVLDGSAPSLAQQQQQQGLQQAMQGAEAQAASARGANFQSSQRAAMLGNSTAAQNNNAQAAMLRAQEVDNARSGLSGLLGQTRSADAAQQGQDFGQAQQAVANTQNQMGLNDAAYGNSVQNQLAGSGQQTQGTQAFANATLGFEQHAADQQYGGDQAALGRRADAAGGLLNGAGKVLGLL